MYTDGGADPNPGPGAIGVVIKNEAGETIDTISQPVGIVTNNKAEYMAVIAALEKAKTLGIEEVRMYADSQLIVRQLNGEYRVRNAQLKPLYQKVIDLKKTFKQYSIEYIPREMNREADKLTGWAVKYRKS
ncbi:MAG: ribonuclease HI family protein [Dehalococcoidales bacterium]|nr:ribonuclease HI family protein [Dehalococcoidales bacterium]